MKQNKLKLLVRVYRSVLREYTEPESVGERAEQQQNDGGD